MFVTHTTIAPAHAQRSDRFRGSCANASYKKKGGVPSGDGVLAGVAILVSKAASIVCKASVGQHEKSSCEPQGKKALVCDNLDYVDPPMNTGRSSFSC